MTIQNGLGAEEIVAAHGEWPLLSAVTFMSGTRHADNHVEYVLDTATWLGPYEETPEADARRVAELIASAGLKAEAFHDLRPAQWSKLIFNATVNGVAALTGLPHDFHFAADERPSDLGHLVHDLVDEGKRGRGGGRRPAARGSLGDERARDRARRPPLPVDARGRRGAPADRDRVDQRRARARGAAPRRRGAAARRRSTGSSRRGRRATRSEDLRSSDAARSARCSRRTSRCSTTSRSGRTTSNEPTSTRSTATACGSPAPARSSGIRARRPTRPSSRPATSASSRRRRCTPRRRSPRRRTRSPTAASRRCRTASATRRRSPRTSSA